MATAGLITVEEYAQLPDHGAPTELVQGRVIAFQFPIPWHGYVCARMNRITGGFVKEMDLGYPISNAGIITGRSPDSLRGADFAFYSYARVPKGALPRQGYLNIAPDLAAEVNSPDDRWEDILAKIADFLNAGVSVVCVFNPARMMVTVYQPDQPEETFQPDDTLTLPSVLPGFSVVVRRFFE